jgi:hypothetical protein
MRVARELDVQHAQDGVRQILTDPVSGYGATGVTDVVCNEGRNPAVKQGGSFMCEVTVDGAKRKVDRGVPRRRWNLRGRRAAIIAKVKGPEPALLTHRRRKPARTAKADCLL